MILIISEKHQDKQIKPKSKQTLTRAAWECDAGAGQRRRFVNLPCSRTLGKGVVVDTHYLDLDWHSPGHTAQPFWSINPSSLLMLLVPSAVPFGKGKQTQMRKGNTCMERERARGADCVSSGFVQKETLLTWRTAAAARGQDRESGRERGRKVCHCN